jgi:hypothetical protein
VATMTATITRATNLITAASQSITVLIQAADADGITPDQFAEIVRDMQTIKDKIVELNGILPGPPNNPVAVALGGRRGQRRGQKRGKTRKIKRRQHKQRGGFQYDKIVKRPSLKSLARSKSRSSSKSRTLSQTRSNRYRNKSRQRY